MVVWRPLIVSQAWLILENHMQILLQSTIPPQIIVNYCREGGEPRFYNNSIFMKEKSHAHREHSWEHETYY